MEYEMITPSHEAACVTCMVHRTLSGQVRNCFQAAGIHALLVESARSIRQRMTARLFGLAGSQAMLDDAPMDIFRATVSRAAAPAVCGKLMDAAELRIPGRGAAFIQDITEINAEEPQPLNENKATIEGLLSDLALITGIMTRFSDGEALARIALKLGIAVPVVGLGTGTGIRDRMGLLRITIPPEKDVVRLIVPRHDVTAILRLFVEGAQLDRPGGGFLYQTPIRLGLTDPMIRIGQQEHAASIEQIIAAIDDLKGDTSWRKRFGDINDQRQEHGRRLPHGFREIVFVCPEGQAEQFTHSAIGAGAPGVTVTRVNCLNFSDTKLGAAARERGVTCVPYAREEAVIAALQQTAAKEHDTSTYIQTLEVPAVFSHH